MAPVSAAEQPLRRFTDGNRVTAISDARRAYSYMYRALRRTFRDDDFEEVPEGARPAVEGDPFPLPEVEGHRIYIAGWKLSPELWLLDVNDQTPDATDVTAEPRQIDYTEDGAMLTGSFSARGHVMGMLQAAIAGGVDVRAQLWRQQQETPDHHTNNTAAVAFLNAHDTPGPRGQAILDAVGRTVGSHHMKAVVVENADGRLAFLGGVDLALGRWDTPEHLPNDPRARGGRNPANDGFHDTHVMIEGPAVDDVETNFRQRWNAHPQSILEGRTPVPARTPEEGLNPIPQASHLVQINRGLPRGVPSYTFASPAQGDPGPWQGRLNAIRQAKRFVYMEDQYLTMVDAADHAALLAHPGTEAISSPPTPTPSRPPCAPG